MLFRLNVFDCYSNGFKFSLMNKIILVQYMDIHWRQRAIYN
jgi:hypothetical protein